MDDRAGRRPRPPAHLWIPFAVSEQANLDAIGAARPVLGVGETGLHLFCRRLDGGAIYRFSTGSGSMFSSGGRVNPSTCA